MPNMTNRIASHGLGAIVLAALLASCAGAPAAMPDTAPAPAPEQPVATTVPSLPAFSSSGNTDMDLWRDDFAARAMASGRDPMVVYETLAAISPLDIYLSEDVEVASTDISDQAEFAKPIWDYVSSAVTETRLENGAGKLMELSTTFDTIEATYGVDREALTAIWAMETNLGGYMGSFDAANTLANMAVEGRRQGFAESELTALMRLQETGEVARDDLLSGWAGAMGHTQFMPSTFKAYAVDFDGDGRKDVWNSPADALASAANYLSASGYRNDEPWGIEVRPSGEFDWALADGEDRRISTWISNGLTPMDGGAFSVDPSTYAELWLPAGASGPKYLLLRNFDVFKTYNRSDSYAFSVGLLTDGVAGNVGPATSWPTDLLPLGKRDVMVMQDALNRLGYDAGPVDGIAGRGTRGALQRFQAAAGHVADGYPSTAALAQVLAAS